MDVVAVHQPGLVLERAARGRAPLAADHDYSTIAAWHHPWFSSGIEIYNTRLQPLFKALYDNGVQRPITTGVFHTISAIEYSSSPLVLRTAGESIPSEARPYPAAEDGSDLRCLSCEAAAESDAALLKPVPFPDGARVAVRVGERSSAVTGALFVVASMVALSTVAPGSSDLVIIGSLAAYVLVRTTERWGTITFYLFLIAIVLPTQLGTVPLYIGARTIGLTGSI